MDIPGPVVDDLEAIVDYLKEADLYLTTAESVTAGRIAAALGVVEGSGQIMESGYVVYSPEAKMRLLGVKAETIEAFTLTSEPVAREMALGALNDSEANAAVATTGIAGTEPMDGIAPGTVCIAWAFRIEDRTHLFVETMRFEGGRDEIIHQSACYALGQLRRFHARALAGDSD